MLVKLPSFHLLVVGVKLIYILASIRRPWVAYHLIFSIKIWYASLTGVQKLKRDTN